MKNLQPKHYIGIGIFVLIVIVVLKMNYRTPPGLSVIGTMFWNDEPAEVVSVILCPAGIVPGVSILGEAGQCEKFAPYAIIDASGKYRFFNIPSGKYTIFYKWPDEDGWDLGETIKESTFIFVEEGSITKVDPIAASRKDWLVEPKGVLDYPSIVFLSDQKVVFRWKSLKDAENYSIEVFEREGERVFFDTVTKPVVEVSLPAGNLSLGVRTYNLKKELIGRKWYFFEVKE